MKKAYIIFAAIASLAVLVSCNKEEIAAPQNDQTQYGPMSITINYDDVDTKTTFTQDGSYLRQVWKEGDAVSVLIQENGTNERFVLTSGAGTKSATFTCNSSYLSTISADTYVRIDYPYTDQENDLNTHWVFDFSNQGNGSIDNLEKYNLLNGSYIKVTYVDGGKNTFAAAPLSALCCILRLPAGLQFLSNAPATDVITNLTISGERISNKRLEQKDVRTSRWENGDITLSNIALTNGCLANDVYVALRYDNVYDGTIDFKISFTLQSNGNTYTYPYTRTGAFYGGRSYKMSQTALNSTRPLIKYVPGALGGVFSVGADKTVMFAKGNLQAVYDGMSEIYTWRFAEHQYDIIGNEAGNTTINSQTEGAVVDLFGWTQTGKYSDGIKQYGINTSTTQSDYRSSTEDTLEDWGKAYAASNGCSADTWFTLSKDEWFYLLKTRTRAAELYKNEVAINGRYNLVIAPDAFTGTIATSYTAEEWAAAEADGLVCLPAGGHSESGYSSIRNPSRGYYWSSSPYSAGSAYCLFFHNSGIVDTTPVNPNSNFNSYSRQSVRLCTLYN